MERVGERPRNAQAKVLVERDRVVVTTTPMRVFGVVLFPLVMLGFGFLFFWYSLFANVPGVPSFVLWILVAPASMGLVVLGVVASVLLDTTRLAFDANDLELSRGPLLRGTPVREPTMQIASFTVKQRNPNFHQLVQYALPNMMRLVPTVYAVMRDGREQPLPLELATDAEAQWIAAELDRVLHPAV